MGTTDVVGEFTGDRLVFASVSSSARPLYHVHKSSNGLGVGKDSDATANGFKKRSEFIFPH